MSVIEYIKGCKEFPDIEFQLAIIEIDERLSEIEKKLQLPEPPKEEKP